MTDLSKRKTIKNGGFATLAIGSGLIGKIAFAQDVKEKAHTGLQLKVSQGDNGALKASLVNHSENAIKLTDISPSQISTPSGDVDLGHLVANKRFSMGPNSELNLLTSYTENKHNASPLLLDSSKNVLARKLLVSTSVDPVLKPIHLAT